jgi:hypothetical protein
MKMFKGQKKLIAGSAIQSLLNYCQENLYVAVTLIILYIYYSPISRETIDDVPRHTMISGNRGWETWIQTMDNIQEINFTLH